MYLRVGNSSMLRWVNFELIREKVGSLEYIYSTWEYYSYIRSSLGTYTLGYVNYISSGNLLCQARNPKPGAL